MTPRDELLVPRDDFDRLLAAWFEADAPGRAPDAIADLALARTARARQRPRWLPFGRWPAMQTALRLPSLAPIPRAAWVLLILAVLVALLAVTIALVGGHKIPPPFGLARTGLLTFDGNGDILVANADGTNSHAITSGPAFDTSPAWSLDGEHIAYFSRASAAATEQSVVVVDANGSNPWVVATISHAATYTMLSWAPDGHRLVYVTDVTSDQTAGPDLGNLAIADLTTRTTKVITHGLAASDPAWSPDGQQIAFKVTDVSASSSVLYLVGADGSNPRRISFQGDWVSFGAPQWSPDGRQILVWGGTNNHDVFVIDPTTALATNLTNTSAFDDFWATFSNDGKRIAFESPVIGGGAIDEVHVMNADGSGDHVLATTNVTGSSLFWSPDDRFLIGFDSAGTSSQNAIVISVDGSAPPTIIPAPGNSLSGSWQRLAP